MKKLILFLIVLFSLTSCGTSWYLSDAYYSTYHYPSSYFLYGGRYYRLTPPPPPRQTYVIKPAPPRPAPAPNPTPNVQRRDNPAMMPPERGSSNGQTRSQANQGAASRR